MDSYFRGTYNGCLFKYHSGNYSKNTAVLQHKDCNSLCQFVEVIVPAAKKILLFTSVMSEKHETKVRFKCPLC